MDPFTSGFVGSIIGNAVWEGMKYSVKQVREWRNLNKVKENIQKPLIKKEVSLAPIQKHSSRSFLREFLDSLDQFYHGNKLERMIRMVDDNLGREENRRLEAAMTYMGLNKGWRQWIRENAIRNDTGYAVKMPWPHNFSSPGMMIKTAFAKAGFCVFFERR